jgi:thiamine-phosphate pyrophosphorylase
MPERSHVQQVSIACQAGINWIQYRCLSKPDKDLLKEINEIAMICDDWGATLIITDHYHLLDQADVQGVHIEDMSKDLKLVRSHIGPEKTLGASANSFKDVQEIHSSAAADYIGCGPYSVTKTKVNDYPLLGEKGYKNIVSLIKENGINIPLLAVGGINTEDVQKLLETGIYGMAVSSAINLASDPAAAIKEFRSYFI